MTTTIKGTLYSMQDAAAAVGIKYNTFWHKVNSSKQIPEPTVQHGRRLYYSPEQFRQIVEAFKVSEAK